jgi:hypothetical protein
MRRGTACLGLVNCLLAGTADAGVSYDLTSHAVSGSSAPTVAQYFVERGVVRVGAADAPRVLLFKDGTIYIIDNPSKSVHVLQNATLARLQQGRAEQVKKMEDMAANAPPDQRAAAEEAAAMTKDIYERMRKGTPRDFRPTSRSETAAAGTCRIWEEFEENIKRVELCVAPTGAVTGGEEILQGMRVLSGYFHGSLSAFGVEFGPVDVWPQIQSLGGLPVIIREFKDGAAVSETTVTGARPTSDSPGLFEIPPDYVRKEGPKVAP